MKNTKGNSASSYDGQKASMAAPPKSTSRHKDPKKTPASGHAQKGLKIKK